MIDRDKLVYVLLEELSAVTSSDERGAHDPEWLRGYVAGVANAASIVIELPETDETAVETA